VRDLPGGFPGDAYPLRANPSFADLVRATSDVPSPGGRGPEAGTMPGVTHGTTVLAMRFAGQIHRVLGDEVARRPPVAPTAIDHPPRDHRRRPRPSRRP